MGGWKTRALGCPGYSGEWRNWQTRWIQVPVSERTWGFKSPLAHHHNSGPPAQQGVRCVRGYPALTVLVAKSTTHRPIHRQERSAPHHRPSSCPPPFSTGGQSDLKHRSSCAEIDRARSRRRYQNPLFPLETSLCDVAHFFPMATWLRCECLARNVRLTCTGKLKLKGELS